MDLTSAIVELATGTYQVTSFARGAWSETSGEYVPGQASERTITAVVVPASGRQVQRLPEGLRSSEVIAIYADCALKTAEADGAPGDRISYCGKVFEVQSVNNWDEAGGFHEAIATRVGQ